MILAIPNLARLKQLNVAKILKKGNLLPSVNRMVSELGFARKTIVKAYTDLKERGIVESKNRLGYFVANDDI